jgi:hypothetical protein
VAAGGDDVGQLPPLLLRGLIARRFADYIFVSQSKAAWSYPQRECQLLHLG